MKSTKRSGFTLVELLVVITILSIISVVAYQNFGGAVDKAVSVTKTKNVTTIESSLEQYKVDNGSYPAVGTGTTAVTGTNVWGYNPAGAASQVATPSNTLDVTYSGEEIDTIVSAGGGGRVKGISGYVNHQIGAKGTISRAELGKRYLSQDLYDTEIGDLKVGSTGKKLIETGIGRYVYAVYKKPKATSWGTNNYSGTNFNIAYTIKKNGSDTYITVIKGNYDNESCYDKKVDCPETLIGSGTSLLKDGQEQGTDGATPPVALSSFVSTDTNQGIPYSVNDFE